MYLFPAITFYNPEIIHGAFSALAFGLLGIALLIIGHKLFHSLDMGRKMTGVDFREQITKGNIAAALYEGMIEAAFLLGLAYIIGRVVSA